MEKEYLCCICGKHECGYGNNPEGAAWITEVGGEPVFPEFDIEDRCCDDCNWKYVIPGRMYRMAKSKQVKVD